MGGLRAQRMSRSAYVGCFAFLLVVLFLGYAYLEQTDSGRGIRNTVWGLNIRHYSEVVAKISRLDQRALESSAAKRPALLDPPIVTPPSGHYPKGLVATIEAADPAHVVHYSLDGSTPTRNHPRVEGSIDVPSTAVLRARAFSSSGSEASDTLVMSYVVNDLQRIPSLHLVMEPVHLFDKHAGIYVNPEQRGRAWERPATLFITSPDDTIVGAVTARIHGDGSRRTNPKNFRIYLDEKASPELNGWFLSSDRVSPDQRQWILRRVANNGQLYADRLIGRVAKQLGLPVSDARPCLLYLNGQLLGVYDVLERMNEEFLKGKDGDRKYELLHGTPLKLPPSPTVAEWSELIGYMATNDLSSPERYDQVARRVDVGNFIDYYVLSIFMADSDRPHYNIDLYKPKNSASAKWKFAVWDFDGGLNYLGLFTHHDTLAWHLRDSVRQDLKPVGTPDDAEKIEATTVFRALMSNLSFRQQFRQRFEELLERELSAEHLMDTFSQLLDDYEEVVPFERQRFTADAVGDGRRPRNYEERLARILDFLTDRTAVVRDHLRRHLDSI